MNPLTISELTGYDDFSTATHFITKKIKITNKSPNYLQNIKLTISNSCFNILNPTIIRERGCLSFDSNTSLLELGNLSPKESLYLEYKLDSSIIVSSLLPYISITFNQINSQTN